MSPSAPSPAAPASASQLNYLTGAIYGLVMRIAPIDTGVRDFAESYMAGKIA